MNSNVLIIGVICTVATLALIYVLIDPDRKKITFDFTAAVTLVLTGLLLEMDLSPLRSLRVGGFMCSSGVTFVCYMIATALLIKKYIYVLKPWQTGLFILAGLLIIQGPVRIFYFKEALISLPDFLMHALGIFAGYSLYARRKLSHKINLATTVLVVMFVCFYGYDLWIYNLNYGTFDGKIHFRTPEITGLHGKNSTDIKIEKGKYVVLDFWFIGCGACMREFPKFQSLYTSYKDNSNIQFYSVNKYMPADKTDSFKYLENIGYTFPMAASPGKDALIKEFGIRNFPTTIVLNKKGEVIYRGDIVGAKAVIQSSSL